MHQTQQSKSSADILSRFLTCRLLSSPHSLPSDTAHQSLALSSEAPEFSPPAPNGQSGIPKSLQPPYPDTCQSLHKIPPPALFDLVHPSLRQQLQSARSLLPPPPDPLLPDNRLRNYWFRYSSFFYSLQNRCQSVQQESHNPLLFESPAAVRQILLLRQ